MSTLIIEHCDCVGADRLGDILQEHGHRLNVVKLHEGDSLPANLEETDAIVVCGGTDNIEDSPDWLDADCELLREAHTRALPMVGICLGHQLLAHALGGEVGRLEKPQIGWSEVVLNHIGREDPLFAGIAWKSMQVHWNSFGVTKLPDDARTLAMSPTNPVEVWAAGLRTYGIAYHPELNAERLTEWAQIDPEGLAESGQSLEDLLRQTEMMFPTYERLSRRLFENIALLLMPVDRRYAGAAKDIHH